LQIEIDAAIERDLNKSSRKRKLNVGGVSVPTVEEFDETTETDKFIGESTLDVINECMQNDEDVDGALEQAEEVSVKQESGIKPDLVALCTVSEKEQVMLSLNKNKTEVVDELDLEGLDDDEINGYILTEPEAAVKDRLWIKMNAEFLKASKEREERAAREREEGKPEKKKRRTKKKPIGPSSTPGEAIEKMLQEKKISTKINYDILKSLTEPQVQEGEEEMTAEQLPIINLENTANDESLLSSKVETSRKSMINLSNNRRSKIKLQIGLPVAIESETETEEKAPENEKADETENAEAIGNFRML
jgi:transcription factor IIIB subunit 2